MKRKIFALLLCFAMVMSLLPTGVFAAEEYSLVEVWMNAPWRMYVGSTEKLQVYVTLDSGEQMPLEELAGAEAEFVVSDMSIADVSEDGTITALSEGTVNVCADVTCNGVVCRADASIEVIPGTSKEDTTYYTAEKRHNARENIAKYDWAASIADAAVAKAEPLVELGADVLYNMIPAPGIPRSIRIGLKSDANFGYCRYCGENILADYGQYGWIVNPTVRPWKVQCPDCKRLFPSNDFESFYKLGLDQHGHFDRMLALESHRQMLLERGISLSEADPGEDGSAEWKAYYGYGEGYLRNELYPDIERESSYINCGQGLRPSESGETWGVDDGYGYNTGVVSDTGIREVHTYIPYYTLFVWDEIAENIEALANACVYTGDMRYGRLGAIMLDRIADIYPAMDVSLYGKEYQTTDGGRGMGKIQGCIWDCNLAKTFALAYDAFFPMYFDEETIRFLSEKAEYYGLENDKTSPEQIRTNVENGILREIYEAVKTGKINGNFGMHQSALAAAAVVLDSEPETSEMLDWIMRTGEYNSRTGENTGGNVFVQIVDKVDRNGMGNEASPQYNAIWPQNILPIAEILYNYENGYQYDLFRHPKFIDMFTAHIPLVLAESHHAQIGDSASTASVGFAGGINTYIAGFKNIQDTYDRIKLAQYIYLCNGNTTAGLHYGIFERAPERLAEEIEEVIAQYGTLPNESEMLTGYGFAVLRDGEKLSAKKNTLRDFWMYFGKKGSHGHFDALNLGAEAYGLNVAPDLGYPESTGLNANRYQWLNATISHNTVVVDGDNQKALSAAATPLHFDDMGWVKVMDVDASDAYDQTDNYRRTVVMIETPDGDSSYGIDFFRVTGGESHTYSFHSQAENAAATEGLEMVPQVDGNGEYVGTYAGPDVMFGADPSGNVQDNLSYPRGYTWMRNVRRDTAPENQFSVEFDVEDYNKALRDNGDIRLRLTQLNDFTPSEVALVGGPVPQTPSNSNLPETLDYLLVQREGENLDTLFTSVIEPYRNERYIKSIENVEISGDTSDENVAKAVKVTHIDGRIDYIVYATDNTVVYNVDNLFDFRGFVGVYSVNENGEVIYRYVNDGDIIGYETETRESYTGTVTGLTYDLSYENYITVKFDEEIYGEQLYEIPGRYIYVENDGLENGAYRILDARENDDGSIQLEVDTTHVRSFADSYDFSKGFIWNIAQGQNAIIPMSYSEDYAPCFIYVPDQTVAAGSTLSVQIVAQSPVDATLTYVPHTLPRGANLDAATGIFTWKPDASQVGEHTIKVGARDEDGRCSYITFKVSVTGSTTGGNTGTGGGGSGGGGGTATTFDGYAAVLRSYYDAELDEAYVKLAFEDNTAGTYRVGSTYMPNPSDLTAPENNSMCDFANNSAFGYVVKYSMLDDGSVDLSAQDLKTVDDSENPLREVEGETGWKVVEERKFNGFYPQSDDSVVFLLYGNPCMSQDASGNVITDATISGYAPVKATAFKISELKSVTGNPIPNLYAADFEGNGTSLIDYTYGTCMFDTVTAANRYVTAAAVTVGETLADSLVTKYLKDLPLAYVVSATQRYNAETDYYYAQLTLIDENGATALYTVDDVQDEFGNAVLDESFGIGKLRDWAGKFLRYELNDEGKIETLCFSDENGCEYEVRPTFSSSAGLYLVNVSAMRGDYLSFWDTDKDVVIEDEATVSAKVANDGYKIIAIDDDEYAGETLTKVSSRTEALYAADGGNAVIQVDENGEICRIFSFVTNYVIGGNGDTAFVIGDANVDGNVDFVDALLVLKHDAGLESLSGDALSAADANADGEADFADAILILKYDAGLISSFK